MAKKAPAQPQPAPQPVPVNPDSQQQAPPQGLVPQAIPQPEPRAVILPWAPMDKPKKKLPRRTLRMAKRKYARGEDVAAMVQSIRSNPNDATPRNMLADYLSENHEGHYTPKEIQVLRTTPHLNIEPIPANPNRPVHFAKLTMADIRAANRAAGGYWFNRGNNRMFGTKYHGTPKHGPGGVFFVTSDRTGYHENGRRFTVREFDPMIGGISTPGHGFLRHSTLESALAEANGRAAGTFQEPQQMSRKYAASDDGLSMDFDSMGEDELPREAHQRPAPAEDITGRTRKQILQQMLDAAKKGHYDPSGMTPRDYINDIENKEDVPQFGGNVYLSDPEDEEPEKFTRFRYARKATPTELSEMFKVVRQNPTAEHIRDSLVDILGDVGRSDEADLLRSNKPHVIEPHGEGFRVRPGRLTGRYIGEAGDQLRQFLNENHQGWDDDALSERLAYLDPRNRHDQIRLTEHFRPEDFHDPEHWQSPVPEGHVRALHIDPDGVDLHSAEDVPFHELGNHYADQIDEEVNNAGFDDEMFQNEHEYERLLNAVRNAPYFD